MNKKYIPFLTGFLCFIPLQGVFAFSGETEKPQTLREMQEEKQQLEKQKSVLQFKWSTFQIGNDSLGDIVKQNLDISARDNLEEIINTYTSSKNELESKLNKSVNAGRDISELKILLLEGKQQFYIDLIPFIQIEKLESFKNYVDNDLTYNEKGKDISTRIEQKNIEQSERLEHLQDKIDDNSRDLRKSIKERIKIKIEGKLIDFTSQEKFQNLPRETKVHIFSNIIDKFESTISKLESNKNPTRALDERIIGLEVVVEILESHINSWK